MVSTTTGELIRSATDELTLLDDVLVIDVGDEATTYAATLLAELGAQVLRLEDVHGDVVRGEKWRNLTHNVGKSSVAVNPHDPNLNSEIADAVAKADVIVGPLHPTAFSQAVLDLAEQLGNQGPSVVSVIDRRAGSGKEAVSRPTTDLTAMAAGGHLILNGHPDDPPAAPAGELAWKQVSLTVALAAMALVRSRRRVGHASTVSVSVQEAVAFTTLQTSNSNHWTWHRHVPNRHSKLTDFKTVQTADGHWVSFTIHPPNWDRFVDWAESVLGDQGLKGPEWDDPDYALHGGPRLGRAVAALAASFDRQALIDHGQSLGLLVLPVHDATGVASDEHLAARDFWEEVDGPDGRLRLPGSPFRTSAGRARRGEITELGSGDVRSWLATQTQGNPNPMGSHRTSIPLSDPAQPLAGVRVVDFCWAIAGPLSTRLLADLGAEIIKIESEHRLDPVRYIGVQPPDAHSLNTNGVFNDCNTNKRAVTINIDTEAGREVAWQLIDTADVVTANYAPERLDIWGFTWPALRERRPELIVANMAVMGLWGPNMGWRSYGSGIVAMCGLAAHSNPVGRTPNCLGTLHTDFTVPYLAATEIMAALHRRESTGEGVYLELAQYETAARLMDAEIAGALNGDPPAPRTGNRSTRHAPNGVYPCKGDDRWLALSCRDDADWGKLCSVMDGLHELNRWGEQDAVDQVIATWSRDMDRIEASELLTQAGVPAAAVEDLADHRSPGHPLEHFWKSIELSTGIDSTVIHQPMTWNGERLRLARAPQWFENTADVLLDDLGLDPDHFAKLVAEQILW